MMNSEVTLNHMALFTDLYELTMAQGFHHSGKVDDHASFTMYFRKNPFQGGYAVACGTTQLAALVESFHYEDDDIEYLKSIQAPGGGALFCESFLRALSNLKLCVDIDAVPEGTIVFPNEPLVRVTGPIMECQLLETALLNIISFQTLIATKAARVCLAAQSPVAEFGLRRAQGTGGIWASRAAIVGGCASTSNVLAGKLFDLPVSGTHAHSWVMAFEDELTAFRAWAERFPRDCVLLIDTYDVRQGLENAITVGLEMKARGERLLGVRIDSGDLAWLAKQARVRLDEVGLTDCGIVLSNDLDEYEIASIREQGAQVASWGVGTKLAVAFDQPTLGGIYKLSATKSPHSESWHDHIKVSESITKLSVPGVLDVARFYQEDGRLAGDMVFDVNHDINDEMRIIDPADELRQKKLAGLKHETLLAPLVRRGASVLTAQDNSARVAQVRAREGLSHLDESQKRILNPHSYPVGLESGLFHRRRALAAHLRGLD